MAGTSQQMTCNRNPLSGAVRFGLAAGAVGLIGLNVTPAYAQESDDDAATTLDRIEITGSRIKRANVEGALPVTVIDRQEIDASGDVSVADQKSAGLRMRVLNSGRCRSGVAVKVGTTRQKLILTGTLN